MIHRSPLALLALLSPLSTMPVLGQNSVCTEVDGEKVFAPLEVDCPPVGERWIVGFQYAMPDEVPDDDGNTFVVQTIAATHGEFRDLTEGIAVGPRSLDLGDCADTFFLPEDADDIFFLADLQNTCGVLSPNSLCKKVTYMHPPKDVQNNGIVVYNTGGCQDKIKLEVSLAPGINSDTGNPIKNGECVSPLVLKCIGDQDTGNGGGGFFGGQSFGDFSGATRLKLALKTIFAIVVMTRMLE